jgi:hypothetical protein
MDRASVLIGGFYKGCGVKKNALVTGCDVLFAAVFNKLRGYILQNMIRVTGLAVPLFFYLVSQSGYKT